MKKPEILFMVPVIIAFGCGDGNGDKADADAAEVLEDQEAIEEITPDWDVPAEEEPLDIPLETGDYIPEVIPDNHAEFDPEQACLDSGGTVENMLCCLLTRSFPDICVQGNCGCAPEHSHEVRVCVCGEGECFDGFSCVHNPWWG